MFNMSQVVIYKLFHFKAKLPKLLGLACHTNSSLKPYLDYNLNERLQRVNPSVILLIGGKLYFTGVMSVTLNFHPQGRMLLMRGKVEKPEAGWPL